MESTSSSLDPLSEMVMVDEQVVACEVEIDGFDMEYEDNQVVEGEDDGTQHAYADDPSVGNEYYQYEEIVDGDPNTVYLYDEDTSQLHQVPVEEYNPKIHHHRRLHDVGEQEIDVEYVEQAIPSTSSSQSTSSAGASGCIPGPSNPQQTYYIRKTVPPGKPIYSPVTFHTNYTDGPPPSRGRIQKRVIKRTHMTMNNDELESMMEDAQTLKKLQTEINSLRKDNEQMKKEYETAHRKLENANMLMAEAKTKNKAAAEEKKQLSKELARAKSKNTELIKEMCPEPEFGYG